VADVIVASPSEAALITAESAVDHTISQIDLFTFNVISLKHMLYLLENSQERMLCCNIFLVPPKTSTLN